MATPKICASCGTIGKTKSYTRGSILIELLLWILLIIPGLIYSLWRLSTRSRVCAECGAADLIPLNTPRGKKLEKEFDGQA